MFAILVRTLGLAPESLRKTDRINIIPYIVGFFRPLEGAARIIDPGPIRLSIAQKPRRQSDR